MDAATRVSQHPATSAIRMVGASVRLASRGRPAEQPLRRAVRDTLLARAPAEERAWAARIEAARRELRRTATPTSLPHIAPAEEDGRDLFSMSGPEVPISAAGSIMSLSERWCAFLLRLVRERAPRSCIELGTAFGISAAYQAAGLRLNELGRLTTLEGSATWAEVARANLERLGLDEVAVRVGAIGETLAAEVSESGPYDFVFIDAEHQEGPTVAHFETLLPALGREAYVVLDDIHWPQMRGAFAAIAGHPEVTCAIDLGRIGVAIVNGGAG